MCRTGNRRPEDDQNSVDDGRLAAEDDPALSQSQRLKLSALPDTERQYLLCNSRVAN